MLLGVTGSIAAYKAGLLARLLVDADADVRVILTHSAERFVGVDTFAALTGNPVQTSLWDNPGEVVHVHLAHDIDVAVVAPVTANVLAKLATGIADDLLTSTLLEATCPLILAPAMHTGMWQHPATRRERRDARRARRPVRRSGRGAVRRAATRGSAAWRSRRRSSTRSCARSTGPRDLDGVRMVVTAGPTQEPIDPVRFIGNRSTGKMGVAVAAEAASRGADVRLVLGPDTVTPPAGVIAVHVDTAEEMQRAVLAAADQAHVVVMAAAVADFRPKAVAEGKLKKEAGIPDLHLEPTPDIIGELGERKGTRILVGFAAETSDLAAAGEKKLRAKHLDLVVVNEVGREGTGFGSDTNVAMILSAEGPVEPLRTWTKAELATAICDRVAGLLARPSGSSP